MFVILSFVFWPLCCLSFWDWQLLFTHLVSSSFSYHVNLDISDNSRILWFLGLLNFRIVTKWYSLKLNCNKMVFFEIELQQNCILWNTIAWIIPLKITMLFQQQCTFDYLKDCIALKRTKHNIDYQLSFKIALAGPRKPSTIAHRFQ